MGDRKRANERLRELVRAHYVESDARTAEDVSTAAIPCTKGCSACCRQLIVATLPEAMYIVLTHPEVVRAALPKLRAQGFVLRNAEARLEARGITDPLGSQEGADAACHEWWLSGERCAFLRDGLCSIYSARPRACRTYFVQSDPALCGAELTTNVEIVDPNSRARGDAEMFELCAREFRELVIGTLPTLVLEAWQRVGR